jgi:gluconate kinase
VRGLQLATPTGCQAITDTANTATLVQSSAKKHYKRTLRVWTTRLIFIHASGLPRVIMKRSGRQCTQIAYGKFPVVDLTL